MRYTPSFDPSASVGTRLRQGAVVAAIGAGLLATEACGDDGMMPKFETDTPSISITAPQRAEIDAAAKTVVLGKGLVGAIGNLLTANNVITDDMGVVDGMQQTQLLTTLTQATVEEAAGGGISIKYDSSFSTETDDRPVGNPKAEPTVGDYTSFRSTMTLTNQTSKFSSLPLEIDTHAFATVVNDPNTHLTMASIQGSSPTTETLGIDVTDTTVKLDLTQDKGQYGNSYSLYRVSWDGKLADRQRRMVKYVAGNLKSDIGPTIDWVK